MHRINFCQNLGQKSMVSEPCSFVSHSENHFIASFYPVPLIIFLTLVTPECHLMNYDSGFIKLINPSQYQLSYLY
jgi:hypothetical protein